LSGTVLPLMQAGRDRITALRGARDKRVCDWHDAIGSSQGQTMYSP